MDVLVLDTLFRRNAIIDQYESFIWTERYSSYGDFELVVRIDRTSREKLSVGSYVTHERTSRVMVVESVEEKTDESGIRRITASGRSIEYWMEERSTRNPAPSSGAGIPVWSITDTPLNIIHNVFNTICRTNVTYPSDNLPFLVTGNVYDLGSIGFPPEIITVEVKPMTVYTFIKQMCDMYNLGFRLIRVFDRGYVLFNVYTGHDRTSLQTARDPVIFSSELDNLSDTSQYTSVSESKNVAYVYGKNGSAIVYNQDVSEETKGSARKVLVVTADDIDLPAGPELDAALQQRGHEELSKYRPIIAFDGKIPQLNSYIYGEHYNLGDIVEVRNNEGTANNMRVTEQIFVSDEEGYREYPTLTTDMLITPGSWLAWDAGQAWEDADEYWEDA